MCSYAQQLNLCGGLALLTVLFIVSGVPSATSAQEVQTEVLVSAPRVAPGESMSVRVRLSNFGSSSRVDAVIQYTVVDAAGEDVISNTETAAVETTASLVHTFTLPHSIEPGKYSMQVSIFYPGQQTPAVSSYHFIVEPKLLGIFRSDFLRYGIIALVAALFVLGLVWIFDRRLPRISADQDYSNVSKKEQVYYEIISDVIQQMRVHEGDRAVDMATKITGLTVDNNTGRVNHIQGDPALVVASLVASYEKNFAKKVNFSLGRKSLSKAIVKTK